MYVASNKAPLFAHLSTTLEGLFSIRLYNVQERFDTYNRTLIDADHKALYSLLLGLSCIHLPHKISQSFHGFVFRCHSLPFHLHSRVVHCHFPSSRSPDRPCSNECNPAGSFCTMAC